MNSEGLFAEELIVEVSADYKGRQGGEIDAKRVFDFNVCGTHKGKNIYDAQGEDRRYVSGDGLTLSTRNMSAAHCMPDNSENDD